MSAQLQALPFLRKKAYLCALLLLPTFACTTPGQKTAIGAGAGAAVGAGVGAIASKNRGKGAIIGGAVGAIVGGAVGNYLDKQAKELEKIAETKRTEDGIVTKLKSDITFDSGKASLKSAGESQIAELAAIIKKYPDDRLTIVGHTDNTGKEASNQTLSENRAKSVMAVLVANGVPANTITTLGAGQNQPVADNKTTDGKAKNRRVEIQITVPEAKN